MKKSEIASKVLSIVLPFLKSRAAKKIVKDVSEAANNEAIILWGKIKPLFIKEDIIAEIEKEPENEIYQKGFEYSLLKKLETDKNLEAELTALLIQQSNQPQSISQINTGGGDNVAGNKIVNN